MFYVYILNSLILILCAHILNAESLFKIEGKVSVPYTTSADWMTEAKILIDGGQYLAFFKQDGSFVARGVPTGSYVVEVAHPVFTFEPQRVDVSSKGKIRARRAGFNQMVSQLAYPIRMKAKGAKTYFMKREELRITDMLMNPMVLMMVVPCLIIFLMPKLMNSGDPEQQKEIEQQMKMLSPKEQMPNLSDLLSSAFGGSSASSASSSNKKIPKKKRSN